MQAGQPGVAIQSHDLLGEQRSSVGLLGKSSKALRKTIRRPSGLI